MQSIFEDTIGTKSLVAILVERLGGRVEITQEDFLLVWKVTLTEERLGGKIVLEVIRKPEEVAKN